MNGLESLDYVYHPTYGYLQRIELPGGRLLEISRNTSVAPIDGRVTTLALDGATTTYAYDGPFLDTET